MNKKVVTLIVLILVIAIAGIIIGFNLAGRSENTNKAENETSNERQINTEEIQKQLKTMKKMKMEKN